MVNTNNRNPVVQSGGVVNPPPPDGLRPIIPPRSGKAAPASAMSDEIEGLRAQPAAATAAPSGAAAMAHEIWAAAQLAPGEGIADGAARVEALLSRYGRPAGDAQPVAVLRFDRGTPGRENEMPTVVSCNRLPDGEYAVYLAPVAAQAQATATPDENQLEKLSRIEASSTATPTAVATVTVERYEIPGGMRAALADVITYLHSHSRHDLARLMQELYDAISPWDCGECSDVPDALVPVRPDADYLLAMARNHRWPMLMRAHIKSAARAANQATEAPAPAAPAAQGEPSDPLQGAANWLLEAINDCNISTLQSHLKIGFNRAERLMLAAMQRTSDGGAA